MPLKTFAELCDDAKARITEITTEAVQTRLEQARASEPNLTLIDVREQDEFRASHLPGALGVGRGILEYHIADLVPDPQTPIILYCRGGNRSALAADSLQKMGYENVQSMTGGYRKWNEEGRPESTDGEPIVH